MKRVFSVIIFFALSISIVYSDKITIERDTLQKIITEEVTKGVELAIAEATLKAVAEATKPLRIEIETLKGEEEKKAFEINALNKQIEQNTYTSIALTVGGVALGIILSLIINPPAK